MDIHHLRHFLAVADELHFGRAAQRLGMTQPPLSQSIQRLEASLGTTLFAREGRRIALTSAGRALQQQARALVTQFDRMERVVRDAAAPALDTLRVGVVPAVLAHALPRTLITFRRQWPGVRVLLREQVSGRLIDQLRRGRLHLAIVGSHAADTTGLATRVVAVNHVVLAVPGSWPLARRTTVRLAELDGLPLVAFPTRMAPYNDIMERACLDAGCRPQVVQETTQLTTQLSMVQHGVGAALMGSWAAEVAPPGVAFLAIEAAPPTFTSHTLVAWESSRITPPLRAFVDLLESHATECPREQEMPATSVMASEGLRPADLWGR